MTKNVGRVGQFEPGIALVALTREQDHIRVRVRERRRDRAERQHRQPGRDAFEDGVLSEHEEPEAAQETHETEHKRGEIARAERLADGPTPAADLVGDSGSQPK